MFYALMRLHVLGILRLVFRFRTFGRDNIPRRGPVLLAANHVSLLDPPVVGAGAPRPLHYMAKAELFRVPLLGRIIRSLNSHPVEREGADAKALRQSLGLLRKGHALLVFPEGTRGQDGSLRPAKPGAGMLAALSDAPVVPVYIQGTGRVLPRGASRPRPGRISVWYGPPLRFARARGRERYQEISEEIMAAIGRLKAEVEGTVTPRPAGSAVRMFDRTAAGVSPASQIH